MKDDPFNVFNEAARRSHRLKKRATPTATTSPQDLAETGKEEAAPVGQETSMPQLAEMDAVIRSISPVGLSPELQEQLAIAKKNRDDLVAQLDKIQSKLGMSTKDMKEYLDNPANFKGKQWELIQSRRAELEKKIQDMLGKEGQERVKKAEVTKKSKDRKSKTLGTRKNWIQVR